VDVFSATYSSPYDDIFLASFGPRLKVHKKLRFLQNTTQATNAAANLNAVRDHAKKTGTTYRFVIFARQDTRFRKNMKDAIMSFKHPDDTVLLYEKHPYTGDTAALGPEKRCRSANEFGWSIKDRSKVTWWCSDRIQVIPWKRFEAFWQLIAGPTLLKSPLPWAPFDTLRWPFECWGELAPLVGGNKHIDFLDKTVVEICKAKQEHGFKREFDVSLQRFTEPNCENHLR